MKVTLSTPRDAMHFVVGRTYLFDDRRNVWVLKRWYTMLGRRIWRRLTWWRHPLWKVTAIDRVAGMVTVTPYVWCWWRWRWVSRKDLA